jgi:recombination protein RecA
MKPLDLTKLRKTVNKSLNIQDGYHDPKIWIDTGNYALNYRISNSFYKGVPLGKVTVFAGESGSGKSYIVAGNLVRHAQKNNILPVILDSEFALDQEWLERLGVDTDPSKLIRWPVSLVDDCAKIVNEFMHMYEEDYKDASEDEKPAILFIIDSLGMLSTPAETDQFQKGDMKGDMGRKAKQLKAFVTQCLKMFGPHKIGMVATNHTYKSQDMFNPDDVISGGAGFIFASSIIVAMQKLKLKEDEDGNKTTEVQGIRSKLKVVKSRYAKPFEEVEVRIPYSTGMDPYSGLITMFEKMGLLQKDGNKLKYVDKTGREYKYFRKDIENDLLDLIMREIENISENEVPAGVDETPKELLTNDE